MARLLGVIVIVAVVALVVVATRRSTGVDQPGAVALATPPSTSAAPSAVPPASPSAVPPPGTALPLASTAAQPSPAPSPTPSLVPTPVPSGPAIPDEGPHPELRDVDGWLQSDVTSLEELRGRVVVVQFWTFGCINCKNTLPNLRELYAAHPRSDLEVVGIHAPEFDWEADPAAISAAAADLGVTWPIVLDTRKRTFHHWQEGTRAYWPRTYVLDREGRIRFDHIGEGAYAELNEVVAALIADPTR